MREAKTASTMRSEGGNKGVVYKQVYKGNPAQVYKGLPVTLGFRRFGGTHQMLAVGVNIR